MRRMLIVLALFYAMEVGMAYAVAHTTAAVDAGLWDKIAAASHQ